MGQSGGHSGTASALLGVTTFLFGALVTPISGLGNPAVAMVPIMGGAGALSIVTVFVLMGRVRLLQNGGLRSQPETLLSVCS